MALEATSNNDWGGIFISYSWMLVVVDSVFSRILWILVQDKAAEKEIYEIWGKPFVCYQYEGV